MHATTHEKCIHFNKIYGTSKYPATQWRLTLQSKNAVAQVIYIHCYHSLPLVKITSVFSPALFFPQLFLSPAFPFFSSSFFWVMECLLLPLSTSTASKCLCASVMIVDFRSVKPLTFLYFHLIFLNLPFLPNYSIPHAF